MSCRALLFLISFCPFSWALSQPAIDGFMRGKGNLDVAPSLTFENFSNYYSKINNPVSVKRTSLAANIYLAYGITNWLDLQVSAPYVYTAAELSNFQDISSYIKARLYQWNLESGASISFMLSAGAKLPMSNYFTESVNSIGQADTAFDSRAIVQYFRSDGFFIMAEAGYTYRLDPVPSSYPFAVKVGWARSERYIDVWYDQQIAIGGRDYQEQRDGSTDLLFRTLGVSFGKIGITYYKPFNSINGISGTLSQVIWGRNVGQTTAISLAYVHRFKLKNQ
ncbi:MAG: hypothetical protein RIC15_12275 [Vicingaceae bacterium]